MKTAWLPHPTSCPSSARSCALAVGLTGRPPGAPGRVSAAPSPCSVQCLCLRGPWARGDQAPGSPSTPRLEARGSRPRTSKEAQPRPDGSALPPRAEPTDHGRVALGPAPRPAPSTPRPPASPLTRIGLFSPAALGEGERGRDTPKAADTPHPSCCPGPGSATAGGGGEIWAEPVLAPGELLRDQAAGGRALRHHAVPQPGLPGLSCGHPPHATRKA